MIAHPILASEDDEDLVVRTIYTLPDALEELFVLAHHVYEDTRTDLKPKLQAQHLEVSKMIQILSGVPSGSFHCIAGSAHAYNNSNNSGTKIDINASSTNHHEAGRGALSLSSSSGQPLPPDAVLTETLQQLEHIWRTELFRVSQASMSWRTPLVRLAQEASELLMYTRVRFPLTRRLLRQLSTSHSFATMSLIAVYLTIVLGMCVAVIAIPSVGATPAVGAVVGVFLAVVLVILSALVLWAYHSTMNALDALFEQLFFEKVVALKVGREGAGGAPFQGDDARAVTSGGTVEQANANSLRMNRQGQPTIRPSVKKHTKTGFYTIPYEGGIGWIDGQFLDTQVVMIGFDESYRVTLWNSAAEATTGFLETECLGRPLSELVDSPSGDIKLDILSMRRTSRSQQSAALKIRLRAFATAPVTLFTIVAPITGSHDGGGGSSAAAAGPVGSILICANAKDNLKEARGFLHDYHTHRIQDVADDLVQQGTLGHEETLRMKILAKFANLGYAKSLEDAARTMVYEWEWTTGNQLFARALGSLLGRCTLVLAPNFPQTLCVNPFIAGTIGNAVQEAPSRCEVKASVSLCTNHNVNQLEVSITVPPSSRPFDPEHALEVLKTTAAATFAFVSFTNGDATMLLQFPCQIAMLVEDFGENTSSADVEGQEDASAAVKCSVNVITLLSNAVDRHNLSMVLLKTIYVSLTNVQDPRDLEKKISGQEVDVIIADRTWFSTAKMLVQNQRAYGSIVLIPLITSNGDDEELEAAAYHDAPYVHHLPQPRVSEQEETGIDGGASSSFVPVAVLPTALPSSLDNASFHKAPHPSSPGAAPHHVDRSQSPAPGAVSESATRHQYIIRAPIQRDVLEALMLEVAKEVEKKKAAIAERDEREKILTLRQDSPWTQGKLLGRGAFGAVYEAMSDLTGGKMAVKMFYFRSEGEEGSINELLNEIKIMCSLNHPNIVHYFYCERKDNSVNLFMELCDHSLADHMMNKAKQRGGGGGGAVLQLKAWSVLRQVVNAVAYLHGRNIAHRDIKPQNILLKEDKIKLTDFGTSRQTMADEELLDTQGTFRYMAPEVYRGEAHTMSCDIWSIGCLACELFMCPPKFMENRFSSLLGTMDEVDMPAGATGSLRTFLEQCLQLNPQLRPTAQMLLLHPLLRESVEVDSLPTVFDLKGPRHSLAANIRQSAFSLSSYSSDTVSQVGLR